MQKKLIALAVAGLVSGGALAQTNVTISGRFAAGFEQYKLGDVAAGHSTENRVSDQSSRVIFNVKEDLGGGLSAVGQVDMRFSFDTGGRQHLNAAPTFFPGGIASGNTFLGIDSKTLGRFTVGSQDIHYQTFGAIDSTRAGGLGNNLAIGMMSAMNAIPVANWTRTNNLMMWDSPNWGGVTARVGYSTYGGASTFGSNEGSGAGDGSKGGSTHAALNYSNGPIVAGYSWFSKTEEQQRRTAGAGADEKGTKLYGGYTFPMGVKVGLGWDKSETQTYAAGSVASGWSSRTAWILPISYTMGNHGLYLSYAKTSDRKGATAASSSDAKGLMVGYDYALSKRSSVGVYYTKLTNNTNASYSLFQVSNASGGYNGATGPAAGNDPSSLYFGLAHTF